MKKIIAVLVFTTLLISCKPSEKKVDIYKNYPENIANVLKKHGGLDNWKKLQVLSFNKGEEAHTVDLHSRKTVVNTPNYSLGFDGKEIWLSQQDSTAFKGNKDFYYNLYFYFYTMPFVLADDGITYEETTPLTFDGVNYPGYKISYASDKGTSPDDNYFVYYNPETFQMEWLGYTVTYFSKKPSDKFKIIRYNDWNDVNGFLLPKSITWYKKGEDGQPTEPAKPATEFTLPLVSQAKLADSFYKKPVTE